MTLSKKNLYILLVLNIFVANSFACKVQNPSTINLAISPLDESSIAYSRHQVLPEKPTVFVNSCQTSSASGKYLMIATGPEVVELSDQMRGINFNQVFVESRCSLKNNPLEKIQDLDKQKKEFKKKWQYLNECLQYQITELGPKTLSFPEDQEGCRIKRINLKSANFGGGYCFFKPSSDSNFKIDIQINKDCETVSGIKTKRISMQELSGEMSFYKSSMYKGDLIDLDAIATTGLHLSTNPFDPIITPSEDYGIVRPVFPSTYALSDIHLGKIEINKVLGNYLRIKTPFIVSNICDEKEIDGVAGSICNYSLPISAEIVLRNENQEEIARWYDGGIASPQWQGIINGDGFLIRDDQLKYSHTYSLEFSFTDPYFDFASLKKRFSSHFEKIPTPSRDIKNDLPDLNQMPQTANIDPIESNSKINEIRTRLNDQFLSVMFPPIYNSICNNDSSKCKKINSEFLHFKSSFKLEQDYNISEVQIKRESNVLKNYQKKISQQPEFSCK